MADLRDGTSEECEGCIGDLCLRRLKLRLLDSGRKLPTDGYKLLVALVGLLEGLPEAELRELKCERSLGQRCPYAPPTPRFDKQLRLWVGGKMVRQLKRRGIQVTILEAFEEAGWPCCIRVSPAGDSGTAAENSLRDAVYELNDCQKYVHFSCDGTRCGVSWAWTAC